MIPWIYKVTGYREEVMGSVSGPWTLWGYWLTLVMFRQKLPFLLIDFATIFIFFYYMQGMQHWSLGIEGRDFRLLASQETKQMLWKYMRGVGLIENDRRRGAADDELQLSEQANKRAT